MVSVNIINLIVDHYIMSYIFIFLLGQSVSGCTEYDYPKEGVGMPTIAPLKSRHKIPLPGALLEQWNGAYNHFFVFHNFYVTILYTIKLLSSIYF